MLKHLRRGVLIAVAISIGCFIPESVSADDSPAPIEQARSDDVTQSVRDFGDSEADVTTYTDGQDDFAELADQIKKAWPRHYVDAEWDSGNSTKTRIYVHPEVLGDAKKLAGPDASYVTASDALSEDERILAEEKLVEKAVGLTGGREAVMAHVDPQTKKAVVTIERLSSADNRATVGRSQLATLSASSPQIDSVTVKYAAPQTQEEWGSGGNWNGASCTAGFTATRDGKAAISSTAHCGSARTYDGARLSKRVVSKAIDGDVQSFIAIGGKRTNKVRYDWGKSRAITRASDPKKGNVVCHFGITSGHRCSEVTAVGKTQYFPTTRKTVGKLIFVKKNISGPGDSGGPWFWSSKAHGIHMGKCGGRSCFSAINSLSKIRTKVYTG